MQEVKPILTSKGKPVLDENGDPVYNFNASVALKAVDLIGKHVKVRAWEKNVEVKGDLTISWDDSKGDTMPDSELPQDTDNENQE